MDVTVPDKWYVKFSTIIYDYSNRHIAYKVDFKSADI